MKAKPKSKKHSWAFTLYQTPARQLLDLITKAKTKQEKLQVICNAIEDLIYETTMAEQSGDIRS